MKINCECGWVIPDITDGVPNKAYLIPDQDWETLWDSIDDAIENPGSTPKEREARCMALRQLRLFRTLWQCPGCGQLFIDDQKYELQLFVPRSPETSKSILARNQ